MELEIDFHFITIKYNRHEISIRNQLQPTESEPRILKGLQLEEEREEVSKHD